MTPRLAVAVPLWQDRPGRENLAVGSLAASLGYQDLWIGEMATYDAFALATAIGSSCDLTLTIGPLAVGVRTATTMSMGIASVSDLTGRTARLAIGASSPRVVSSWHGRPWDDNATRLVETAEIVRRLLDGGRTDHPGSRASSVGFRLRLAAPGAHITVAAFGPAALAAAAAMADRVVFNMVTVATARRLSEEVRRLATAARRPPPTTAVWLTAAVDPAVEDRAQMAWARAGYLAAPGYGEMLVEAGFGDLVELARSGASLDGLSTAMPPELDDVVGMAGSAAHVRDRIDEYGDAGIDEVCLVVPTAGDDNGRRTLTTLAPG
jgi:probable F420-dependent oxidoreductase